MANEFVTNEPISDAIRAANSCVCMCEMDVVQGVVDPSYKTATIILAILLVVVLLLLAGLVFVLCCKK